MKFTSAPRTGGAVLLSTVLTVGLGAVWLGAPPASAEGTRPVNAAAVVGLQTSSTLSSGSAAGEQPHITQRSTTEPATVTGPVRYITPSGAGNHHGTSLATAGRLSDLPALVRTMPQGGQVLVRSDLGQYHTTKQITLKWGGSTGHPVVIRGVDGAGRPSAPLITGTRTAPYSATGHTGSEVFRLLAGADHLTFSHLDFANQGSGVVRVGADIADLTIADVQATNVARFLEDYRSGSAESASINGLTMRRVSVRGYSKSVARLQYGTHDVLMEDVFGDSQRQGGDPFAMGVHLDGTVHDVVLRRVQMDNSYNDSNGDSSKYWNGDGFATERGVSRVRFEDTAASGSTDGGYDIKSTATTLVNTYASGNKRNYRLWANDTVVQSCRGASPVKRGGTSAQAQVWLGEDAHVQTLACVFSDGSPNSIVFELSPGASLTVLGGSVQRAGGSRLALVEKGANLTLDPATVQVIG